MLDMFPHTGHWNRWYFSRALNSYDLPISAGWSLKERTMVAVRSAHINKAVNLIRKNGSQVWVLPARSRVVLSRNLGVLSATDAGASGCHLLLWRGVEMVEILSTLSMDMTRCGRRCCSLWLMPT